MNIRSRFVLFAILSQLSFYVSISRYLKAAHAKHKSPLSLVVQISLYYSFPKICPAASSLDHKEANLPISFHFWNDEILDSEALLRRQVICFTYKYNI